MNVVRLRIEKALRLAYATSRYAQNRDTSRKRRGTYKRGVIAFPHSIHTKLSDELKERLDRLCALHNIERGVVIRDALTLWLDVVEKEPDDPIPTTISK